MRRLALILLLAGCGGADELEPAPSDPSALHAFLSAGEYRGWRSEPGLREGLNGSRFRVFLRDDIDPSSSPVGAAAVRELWDADGEEQLAWSALVKVEEGAGVDAWFFYETYDFADPTEHHVADRSAPTCAGCHASAPDVIQSRY